MSPKRATAYVGLSSVLAAWLATAAGLTVAPAQQEPPAPVSSAHAQQLADEIQVQATRLRERLAAAPVPRQPFRNPFAFAPRIAATTRRAVSPAPAVDAADAPPPEPPLQLVGVAERKTDTGSIRTAMITADSDELFMLTEGETLGGRYRVKAVTETAVELIDLVTGASRRLVLR
jgi:hypothetical protein